MKSTPALATLALLAIACGHERAVHTAGGHARAMQSCSYGVSEVSAEPAVLEVTVRCVGSKITGFSPGEPAATAFTRIVAKHAHAAEPVALADLFTKLGVLRNADGSITLNDHAELAAIRHAITFGTR